MENSSEQQSTENINVKEAKLWNPNAAANWSLLFTPIFGAWLQAKNWEELEEPKAARTSMFWVYGGIFFVLFTIFIHYDTNGFLGLVFILVWYFTSGKKQIKYVADKEIKYQKRSWVIPVVAGFAGLILYICVYDIATEYAKSSSQNTVTERLQKEADRKWEESWEKYTTINLVKDTKYGTALERYSYFQKKLWGNFKATDGRRIIQFTGMLKISPEARRRGLSKAEIVLQFVLNDDNESFSFGASEITTIEHGRKKSNSIETEGLLLIISSGRDICTL